MPFKRCINKTPFIHKYFKDGETIPPLSKGLFGLPGIPKPVEIMISFGNRIDTSHYKHCYDDEDSLWDLRNTVELEMDKMFIKMLEFRKTMKRAI